MANGHEKFRIAEWPNSKIGHSLRIWPFACFGHSLVRSLLKGIPKLMALYTCQIQESVSLSDSELELKPLPEFNKRMMVVNIGDKDLYRHCVGQCWLSRVRNG